MKGVVMFDFIRTQIDGSEYNYKASSLKRNTRKHPD
jgi:hypothetical protein